MRRVYDILDPELVVAVKNLTAEVEKLNNALYSVGEDQLLVTTTALADPAGLDDYSSTTAEMQKQSDPYPEGTPSKATDFVGEVTRLRFQLAEIMGEINWYNDPDDTIANIVTRLVALEAEVLPQGVIMQWAGTIANIPAGWTLCDGTPLALTPSVPNLVDQFVICAGNLYAVDASAGALTHQHAATGSHLHYSGSGQESTSLWTHNDFGYRTIGRNWNRVNRTAFDGAAHEESKTSTASNHQHTAANHLPPYYALAFMYKL